MGKNYEKLGDEIITRLGGEQNITKLFHCATRLRFQLADMSKADLEGIKKLPDVMGLSLIHIFLHIPQPLSF